MYMLIPCSVQTGEGDPAGPDATSSCIYLFAIAKTTIIRALSTQQKSSVAFLRSKQVPRKESSKALFELAAQLQMEDNKGKEKLKDREKEERRNPLAEWTKEEVKT